MIVVVAAMLAACLCASPNALARTLSVSPSGSDASSGSPDAPFATVSRAAGVARGGDTVLVESGRYRETVPLTINSRGVTFRGVGATRPVIDGEGTRSYGFRNVNGSDVTIEGFEITGQVEAGIYSLGLRNVIRDNLLHHIGSATETHSNGIRVVQGGSATVTRNTIHHVGPGSESMGIWLLETRDAVVEGNVVYLVRKEGIRDWKGLDNSIIRNRVLLNWAGISLNTSTGSSVTDNYVYDNVEGLVAKHLSSRTVLAYWSLPEARWSRFARNTVHRSSEASLWIGQSDEPLDYLDVRQNVFAGPGYAYVRDRPTLRGPNVMVDENVYAHGGARYLYKEGWSSDPGLNNWSDYGVATGWERNGGLASLALADPARGDLESSSAVGAHGLPASMVAWTPFSMTAVDSSSKGTYYTKTHLQKSADGDQASYWLTATNQNEYVVYDFGRQRTFNHLVLTIFAHFDKRAPHGYRFEVSEDGQSWQTVLAGTNEDSAGSARAYELASPATARYLRFTMVDTFCQSYAPRTNCGQDFVLSDLQAGFLSSVDEAGPDSPPAPAQPPAGIQAPTTPSIGPAPAPAAAPRVRATEVPVAPRAVAPPASHDRTVARSTVRVSRRGVLTRRGRLRIAVACERSSAAGRLLITLSGPEARGRPAGANAFSLGRARVAIGPACRRSVEVRLRPAARRQLSRRGVLRIRAVVRVVPGGVTASSVVLVRRAARRAGR